MKEGSQMKKLVELEMFFTTGDDIKIPEKYIKYFKINGIKKVIDYFTEDQKMYKGESAEGFRIEVLKEYLYNRKDFTPYDENMDIIKNLIYIERIKDYDNFAGIILRYNNNAERTIGIIGNEDIVTVEDDDNIVTIEIK